MKTVYSTIIVSLLLFSEALFPNYAGAVVCQNKTAIVYSNGMFNDADEAGTSKKELFKKLLASNLIYGDSDLYEYHLAYADEKDGLGNTVKDQLMEVYYQKQAGLLSSFWRWLGSVEVAPQWFHEQMLLMAQATTAINFSIDPDFQKMLNGGGTTDNPGYRKLLIDGKRVLIVSHSQGNFYANAVYETLTQEKPAWSSSIGNVQVATPAGYVASGGPYTTVPEDAAMAFIPGKLAPSGSVSSQAYNLLPYSLVVSPNFVNLGSTAWEKASRGHSFVNWYLAWSYTRDRILGHIVTTVGGLQYPKKCVPVNSAGKSAKLILHGLGTENVRNSVLFFGFDSVRGLVYRIQMPDCCGPVNRMSVTVTDTNTGAVNSMVVSTGQSRVYRKKLRVTPTGFVLLSTKVDVADDLTISSMVVPYGYPVPYKIAPFSTFDSRIAGAGEFYSGYVLRATAIPYGYDTFFNVIEFGPRYNVELPSANWLGGFETDFYKGIWKHNEMGLQELYPKTKLASHGYATYLGGFEEWLYDFTFDAYSATAINCMWARIESKTWFCAPEPSLPQHIFTRHETNRQTYISVGVNMSTPFKAWVMEPSLDGQSWVVTPIDGVVFKSWYRGTGRFELIHTKANGAIVRLANPSPIDRTDNMLTDNDIWRLLGRAPLANPQIIQPVTLPVL